jgi:hypothetical protein
MGVDKEKCLLTVKPLVVSRARKNYNSIKGNTVETKIVFSLMKATMSRIRRDFTRQSKIY